MALAIGKTKNLEVTELASILSNLQALPTAMEKLLLQSENIKTVAKKYAHYKNFFYLGRQLELPVAMEGSLKLKELSYIHSEAYSSGELKHGSIALIDADFPTIIVNGQSPLHGKNLSSVEEIKSRGGKVIGIIESTDSHKQIYTDTLEFEPLSYPVNAFLETVIIQLFSCYVAMELGRDVDKPRNLAKSVTVE